MKRPVYSLKFIFILTTVAAIAIPVFFYPFVPFYSFARLHRDLPTGMSLFALQLWMIPFVFEMTKNNDAMVGIYPPDSKLPRIHGTKIADDLFYWHVTR